MIFFHLKNRRGFAKCNTKGWSFDNSKHTCSFAKSIKNKGIIVFHIKVSLLVVCCLYMTWRFSVAKGPHPLGDQLVTRRCLYIFVACIICWHHNLLRARDVLWSIL